MKKIALLTVTLLTLLLAGCQNKDYYPTKDISTSGVNQEALDYYKEEIKKSNVFDGDIVMKLSFSGGNPTVYVYEVDKDGKAVKSATVDGDIVWDIMSNIETDSFESIDAYSYDFVEDGNKIIGNHTIFKEILEEQDENDLADLKDMLEEDGFEKANFSFEDGILYYGNYQLKGDAADRIINRLYGQSSNPFYHKYDKFDFTEEDGVITCTNLDKG